MPSALKPMSLRLPPELRAQLSARAETHGHSDHAEAVAILRAGLDGATADPEAEAVERPRKPPAAKAKAAPLVAKVAEADKPRVAKEALARVSERVGVIDMDSVMANVQFGQTRGPMQKTGPREGKGRR